MNESILPELYAPRPLNWDRHLSLSTSLARTWTQTVERLADALFWMDGFRVRKRGAGLDAWAEFTVLSEDGRECDWYMVDAGSEGWQVLMEKLGVECSVVRYELARVVHWRATMGVAPGARR